MAINVASVNRESQWMQRNAALLYRLSDCRDDMPGLYSRYEICPPRYVYSSVYGYAQPSVLCI